MARFKVLFGSHNEGGRTYKQGEVVDSKSDLNRMNSPGSTKFEALSSKRGTELEDLDDDQLKQLALEREIELSEDATREEILIAIRG